MTTSFEKLEGLADNISDGHYTIMKFTTGYKVMFGTPEVVRDDMNDIEACTTLEAAIDNAVKELTMGTRDALKEFTVVSL